jgi:cytochrome c2
MVVLASPQQTPLKPETSSTHNRPANAQEGEQKFMEHCARCHKPPESLPRSAVPAVLRHMRVRANLPARDEQDILRFMIP